MRDYKKHLKPVLFFLSIFIVLGGVGFGGYYLGVNRNGAMLATGEKADLKYFWKAWDIVNKNFIGDLNDQKRIDGAISGMVAGLGDPYTVYLPPTENKIFQSDLEGEFSGIGAELTVKNGYLTVVAPLEGTPAAQAGIQSNDVITQIDGKKTAEISFNEAIEMIRGKIGTEVKLTILRAGEDEELEITVKRDTIVVKSVKYENIGENSEIGYLKINQFGKDTVDLVSGYLNEVKTSGKQGLVIDLRNDPGGYLDSAVKIAGLLIPDKISSDQENLRNRVVVVEKDKDGKETKERSTETSVVGDLPLTVLVNGGSASASEILAGALKDYGRAKIVGEKSFGKGSVQNLIDLGNGGGVKVTIAKWYTPLGSGIDGKGIEPDEKIELAKDELISAKDTQVKKCLELLKK